MTQSSDDPYEDYYNNSTTTTQQYELLKWQQEEIYLRNNPEKLPELKPLANSQDARGVIRKSTWQDQSSSDDSKKRQRE